MRILITLRRAPIILLENKDNLVMPIMGVNNNAGTSAMTTSNIFIPEGRMAGDVWGKNFPVKKRDFAVRT